MGNPSTIWAQLALPNPAAGSLPYVDVDNISIVTNVQYYWFNPVTYQLSIGTKGDQTGTDTLNTYYNQDSYWTYSGAVVPLGANGTTAGHTVSTSRGTGINPALSNTGDFIGKYSGWCYTGSAAYYQEVAGINLYVSGTTNSANGAGGELRFFTKQDNVSTPVEWIKLTFNGYLQPVINGGSSLGAAGFGWNGLYLSYVVNPTAANTVTCNAPTGRVKLAGGNSLITVNNSFVTSTSVVCVSVESADATALYVKTVTVGNGFFTVTMNAASTGVVGLSFISVNN